MKYPASLRRAVAVLLAFSTAVSPVLSADFRYQVPVEGADLSAATPGALSLSPGSHGFGTVVLGGSAGTVATLRNVGQDSVSITDISVGAPYSQVNSCPAILVGGAECTIGLTYTPSSAGSHNGALTVSGTNASATTTLSGNAVVPTTDLTLSAASVSFTASRVGTPASQRSVTITNTGNSPATVSGIGVVTGASDFGQSNNCGSTLAPGAACTVNVSFLPTVYGARAGTLNVYEEASSTLYSVALQGFGNAAVLAAAPSSISFPAAVQGYPKTATVTVSNTGNEDATGVQANSSNAEFTVVDPSQCPLTLTAGTSCTLTLQFAASGTGSKTSNLTVSSTNAGTQQVSLSGSSVAQNPSIVAAPGSVDFVDTPVSETSAVRNVSLTNQGNVPVEVTGLSVVQGASDFKQTNDCAALAVGASCSLNLTFAPTAKGTRTGLVHLAYGSKSLQVSLTGKALQGVSSLSAASVDFGDVQQAHAATTKTVTVTNVGDSQLTIQSATVPTSNFTATTSCAKLAPAASCVVTVGFTPTSLGAISQTLTVLTDAGSSTVSLTGKGVKGNAALSTTALSFNAQQVNTTSTQQTVTVTNSGTSPLVFSGVSVVGGQTDFAQSNNCASVPVNGTCAVVVTFTPTTTGTRTGTIALQHDGDGLSTVSLSGVGQAPSGTLTVGSFATTQVGATSDATAVLTNTGVGPLTVTTPSAASVTGASFSYVSNTCASSLAPAASCNITVRFTAPSTFPQSGTLSLTTGAGTLSQPLAATGVQGTASVSPSALTFAAQQVASTSGAQTVTVTNTGTSTLAFSGVGIATGASDFGQSNNCASVAVGASCTVQVSFTPSTTGARSGSLALVHNGAGVTTVSLSGTGQAQSASLTTPSFAATAVGGSNNGVATLTNTGIGVLSVTVPNAGSVSGTDFGFNSTTCGATVAVGAACTVSVKFSPTSTAARSGSLVVSTGAGTQSVSLGSTGIQGYASVSPSSLTYATQQVASTSAVQTVTVTNTGTNTLTFSGVGIASGSSDFAQSNNCGSVAVNGTCSISVTFTPSVAGARSGTLALTHNGGGIATVSLSGTGQAASATITSNGWGSVQVGDAKAGTQTITNTGIGALTLTGTPSVNAPFTYVSNNCPASLSAGASCIVNVSFTPAAAQTYTQTLNVPTNAGTLTSSATGTGVAASLVVTTSGNLGSNLTPLTISGWHQTFQNNGIGNVTITGAPSVSGGTVTSYVGTASPYCFNGMVLSPAATCVVWTQINQAAGTYSGTLSLPSSAGTVNVAVSGTVVGTISTSAAAYGDVPAGSTKDMTVTVSNTAAWLSRNMAYSATAPFSIVANNCGATIAANSSCTMTVRYSPTGTTSVSGNYVTVTGAYGRIRDPGVEESQYIGSTITAYGVMSGRATSASLVFTPSSAAFGSVQIGQSSAQAVTISNPGNVAATGLGGNVPAGFSVGGSDSTCGASLGAGATCKLWVTFTPTAAQAYSSAFTVPGSNIATTSLPVSGTGVAPSLTLTSYGGGGTPTLGVVGRFSDSGRWPIFKNTGSGPVTISSHTATGGFWAWQGDSSNAAYCFPGQTLAAGASCQTFFGLSTDVGDYSGTETMTYTGTGSSTAYAVATGYTGSVRSSSANQSSIAFGNQTQNQWNGPITVRVTNYATGNPLRNVSISLSGGNTGNFSVGGTTCGGAIAAGGYCDIPVYFNPTANSSGYSSTLVIQGGYPRMEPAETTYISSTGVSIAIPLSGNGAYSQATLTATAAQGFGGGWYGQSYSYLNWTYRNDGNAAMTLASPGLSAPMGVSSNNCSGVAPGASCTIQVVNYWNADAINGSQSFTPSGASIAPAGASVSYTVQSAVPRWSTTGVAFGNVTVGASSTQNITLYNDGNVAYNWRDNGQVVNVPTGFSFNLANCTSVPGNGGSCTVPVTFTPPGATSYGGSSIYETAASRSSSNYYTSVSGSGVAAPTVQGAGYTFFSPATVTAGTASTFYWQTSNATSASVSCSGAGASASGSGTSGSIAVGTSSVGQATCNVTAYNAAGTSASAGATLNVVAAPQVATASFNASSVTAGNSATFSWTTSNASSASVSCSGAGATATGSGTSGSINVATTSAGTATCRVTASNLAGASTYTDTSLSVTNAAVLFTISSPTRTVSSDQYTYTYTYTITNPGPATTISSFAVAINDTSGKSNIVRQYAGGSTCVVGATLGAGASCTRLVEAERRCTNSGGSYQIALSVTNAAGTVSDAYSTVNYRNTDCK